MPQKIQILELPHTDAGMLQLDPYNPKAHSSFKINFRFIIHLSGVTICKFVSFLALAV